MYQDKFNQSKKTMGKKEFEKPKPKCRSEQNKRQKNRFLNNEFTFDQRKARTDSTITNSITDLPSTSKFNKLQKLNRQKKVALDILDNEPSKSSDEEVANNTVTVSKKIVAKIIHDSNSELINDIPTSPTDTSKDKTGSTQQRSDSRSQNMNLKDRFNSKSPSPLKSNEPQKKQQFETNRRATKPGTDSNLNNQKKIYQKSYYYKNKNINVNKNIKNASNQSKIITKAKALGNKIIKAASSKGVVISGVLIGLVILFIFVVVMFFLLIGSSLDTKYLFTEEEATYIEQSYTKKELEYLNTILKESDKHTGDFNVNIDYDPVGHDPHEILSLFNVMLRYELEENDMYSFDSKQINRIIDDLISARYEFTKETENVVRNVRVENEDGSTSVEQITTSVTNIRSKTNSINNIIAGASFDTPKNTDDFISAISSDVQEVASRNDLYASVILAQAILETGSGSSDLSKPPYFNLFGIKGSYNGESVTMYTQEDDGLGNLYTISARFRDYPSYKEAIEDYAIVMREQPSVGFYAPTYKSNTSSYKQATAYLTGTYATDTQYGSKLNKIIQEYNLTRYDKAHSGSNGFNSNSDLQEKEEKIERILGGNLFALTDYERDLYQRTFDAKGIMGTYPSPVSGVEVDKLRVENPYGYAWDPNTRKIYTTDGLLVKVDSGLNVISQITGKVSKIKELEGKAIVTIESKDTLTIEYGYLDNINVAVGSHVRRGDVIGKTSSKGLRLKTHTSDEKDINPLMVMHYENPKLYMYNAGVSSVNSNSGSSSNNQLNQNMAGKSYDDLDVDILFNVAKKYIGYPYVFGGASPSTSFDCSGFIYWVYKEAGLKKWSRTTANEMYYSHSAPISEEEARPGDLIFFEGTYNAGVPITHVGIYAGDGIMLHAGDPIGFTSFKTSYWQQHNPTFGRLVQD